MRRALRWLGRGLLVLLVLILLLLAPVAYTEVACRPQAAPAAYASLLPEADHRPESRTLMTYPEWHIVHAYDDYARVIRDGDPHDYGYLRGIGGFWSSLCALSKASGAHGGVDTGTKQMVYVIGTSFTAELLLKAAYEETLGRIATWIRGADHADADEISARQAADYAAFLRQTPWYRWDFRRDAVELQGAGTSFRDRERKAALGLEFRAKAAYAKVIENAVAGVGPDALRLKMIATDLPAGFIAAHPDITLIETRPEGAVIETPRYAALTGLLEDMADAGANFVEIAGNDDIMFTAISDQPTASAALADMPRQGYGDYRHLIAVKVTDLAKTLRNLDDQGLRLEHIHDY
ncbi:hypothetical protein FQV27_14160 [Paracoccus aurantiacus]|uniref:Uncharacterized protein n=1 Tax=Paracoccus aurantiacus TaxID=2599412 RepID=A0A5C6S0F2_9RHOB|nr:hypothetical protein [Paracoccus aurantiacus]TXB67745.1 hypothetical protein FQV27_14160 [Paracoccus aurantiacus]